MWYSVCGILFMTTLARLAVWRKFMLRHDPVSTSRKYSSINKDPACLLPEELKFEEEEKSASVAEI